MRKPEEIHKEIEALNKELATWEDGAIGGTVYIRSVGNKFSQVSHVRGVSRLGADVLTGSFAIENSKLTIRPREYFIGRR